MDKNTIATSVAILLYGREHVRNKHDLYASPESEAFMTFVVVDTEGRFDPYRNVNHFLHVLDWASKNGYAPQFNVSDVTITDPKMTWGEPLKVSFGLGSVSPTWREALLLALHHVYILLHEGQFSNATIDHSDSATSVA